MKNDPLKELVVAQDNTKVEKPIIPQVIKMDPEKWKLIQETKRLQEFKRNQALLWDADKVEYYENLLKFYNNNFFGNGVSGKQTKFDPRTQQDLILANFDYAKQNMLDFSVNLLTGFTAGLPKALLPRSLRKPIIGKTSTYTPFQVGEGAESVVINNSPTTVGKFSRIGALEMKKRNAVPNSVPHKFVGYVKKGAMNVPAYVLKKVDILTNETFPKYLAKLDKAMARNGFRVVDDPAVLYRAYTNGRVVVDDIAPGNVGLDWLRRPKMIDFNYQTVPQWIEQGFDPRYLSMK